MLIPELWISPTGLMERSSFAVVANCGWNQGYEVVYTAVLDVSYVSRVRLKGVVFVVGCSFNRMDTVNHLARILSSGCSYLNKHRNVCRRYGTVYVCEYVTHFMW